MDTHTIPEAGADSVDPLPDSVRRLDALLNRRVRLAVSEAELNISLRAKSAAKRELVAVAPAQLDATAQALLAVVGGQ